MVYSSRYSRDLRDMKSNYVTLLGTWETSQIKLLDLNMSGLKFFTDWHVFRGRRILTAWQASRPEYMMVVHDIFSVIYWIGQANYHGFDWYRRYKMNKDTSSQADQRARKTC